MTARDQGFSFRHYIVFLVPMLCVGTHTTGRFAPLPARHCQRPARHCQRCYIGHPSHKPKRRMKHALSFIRKLGKQKIHQILLILSKKTAKKFEEKWGIFSGKFSGNHVHAIATTVTLTPSITCSPESFSITSSSSTGTNRARVTLSRPRLLA